MIEIIIITYNRIESLRRTIKCILDSKLCGCKITIIDNCSNDGTFEYLQQMERVFDNFIPIRNAINIGPVGNLLRAYEMASEDYLWIICDDDQYDFEKVDETLSYIEINRPDVLLVGTQVPQREGGIFNKNGFQSKILGENDLVEIGYYFTFLPSAIILKNRLHACNFREAFEIADTYFPQMFWIRHIFDPSWNVHVSKYAHITRPPIDHGLASDFRHLNGYLKAVGIISDVKYKNKMAERIYGSTSLKYAKFIAKKIIKDRYYKKIDAEELNQHLMLVDTRKKIIFLAVRLLVSFIPAKVINLSINIQKTRMSRQ